MGQGLYRCYGFGCLNPPPEVYADENDWLRDDFVKENYETKQRYLMIPLAVDDEFLQDYWMLPGLPDGLPNVADKTAIEVNRLANGERPPVPWRAMRLWEFIVEVALSRGIALPQGVPIFVCDFN